MSNVALVSGADRGLGRALVQALLERGWTVVAGRHLDWPELDELALRFPSTLHLVPIDVGSDESVSTAFVITSGLVSHIDLLISNAAVNRSHHVSSIRHEQNFANMQLEMNVNAVGALRLVHTFLPLLDRGGLKLLCFVSSEAGSIGASKRNGWFGYCMSKAALNMAVKNMANDLTKDGYRFRLYHPGWLKTYMSGTKNEAAAMEPEEGAALALKYFLDDSEPLDLALHGFDGSDFVW